MTDKIARYVRSNHPDRRPDDHPKCTLCGSRFDPLTSTGANIECCQTCIEECQSMAPAPELSTSNQLSAQHQSGLFAGQAGIR
jgi:hypothetical protein